MTPAVDVGLENGRKNGTRLRHLLGVCRRKRIPAVKNRPLMAAPALGYKGFCAGDRRSSVQSLLSVDSFGLLGTRPD